MGDLIAYKEEQLGVVHLARTSGMYLLNMDGIESLEKLLQLNGSDVIKVGEIEMPYERFKKEVIEKAEAIYLDTSSYLRKETDFPTGTHFPTEILDKIRLKLTKF